MVVNDTTISQMMNSANCSEARSLKITTFPSNHNTSRQCVTTLWKVAQNFDNKCYKLFNRFPLIRCLKKIVIFCLTFKGFTISKVLTLLMTLRILMVAGIFYNRNSSHVCRARMAIKITLRFLVCDSNTTMIKINDNFETWNNSKACIFNL